jgi:hypothetical protein
MKAGTQNTWKTLVMALLMAIALPLAIYNSKGMLWRSPAVALLTTARPAAQPAMLLVDSSSCVNLDVLDASRRITYQLGRNIFDMQPLAPKKIGGEEKADGEKVLEQAPTPVPTSIPLKFYGFSKRRGDQQKVFLQNGDRVFVAELGNVVDRRYCVVQIRSNEVVLEDMLTNNRQTIVLAAR